MRTTVGARTERVLYTALGSVPIALDPEPVVDALVFPLGELRAHGPSGRYDEDGSPIKGWRVLAAGPVALHLVTKAAEPDGVEQGTAMIGTSLAPDVFGYLAENTKADVALVVADWNGSGMQARFAVTELKRFPDRLEMRVRRAR